MTYVITDACEKDAACVATCPVDCIQPAPGEAGFDTAVQLFIDPVECICCDACVTACPVDAVWSEEQLPPEDARFLAVNAQHFR